MTIRRKVAAAGAIVLCAGVVVVALRPTEARAAIVKTSGAVQSVPAPPSVRPGAYVSNSKIQAFTATLSVTLPNARTFEAPVKAVSYNRRSQLPSRQIPAGTPLSSHLLHGNVSSGSK